MPSLYTHQLIARKVFDELEQPEYIKRHYGVFLLGSIGLDMFSYHNLLKVFAYSNLDRLGTTIKYSHHKEFLLELIEISKDNPEYMVYVTGFLCSYATDKTIRPFIHYQTEKPEGGADANKQVKFEQALDAYLYRKGEHEGMPRQGDFLGNMPQGNLRNIANLVRRACNAALDGKKIHRMDIVSAYIDTYTFTRKLKEYNEQAYNKMRTQEVLLGKKGALTILVPPHIIPGNDWFNLAHRGWRVQWEMNVSRSESIIDLVDMSIESALDIINIVNGYYLGESSLDEVEDIIGNINFNGREMQ